MPSIPGPQRIAKRIVDLGDSLCEFSERGRLASDGLRELTIVPPYLIRYKVDQNHVVILQVWHGARLPNP